MSWRVIARKDVRDASRSLSAWLFFGFFAVSLVGFTVVDSQFTGGSFDAFVGRLAGGIGLVVPLLALVLGYNSISGERTDRTIVLTLSFPHNRREFVLGKFAGRSIVLLVPILATLLFVGGLGAILYDSSSAILWYPWFLLVTAVYGLAFLAIAFGISMSSTLSRRVTLGAFGAYLLLVMIWDNLVTATVLVLYRFDFEVLTAQPEWAYLAAALKPSEAYYLLLNLGFDIGQADRYTESIAPWFVDWWTAVPIVLVWLFAPIVLGFRRFRDDDL